MDLPLNRAFARFFSPVFTRAFKSSAVQAPRFGKTNLGARFTISVRGGNRGHLTVKIKRIVSNIETTDPGKARAFTRMCPAFR